MNRYTELANRLEEIMHEPYMTTEAHNEAKQIIPELRRLYLELKSDNNRRFYNSLKKEPNS